ncbi:MAG: prepilin-type N-terminal cleavage/methylation domain-containing protein [Planctomycetota bacterium]|nr:prepilin-type N-terminal cleavage/methylation domain-containing protein [Planctomycetota bacterium]
MKNVPFTSQPTFEPRRHRTDRRGFTLFEMLLVMTLIAVGIAIAWPSLAALSSRQQLQQGAEMARIRLLSARVFAVENGIPYQFRFEPGGQRYCVLHGDSAAETALPAGGGTVKLPIASGKLPGKITFDPLTIGSTGGGMIPETRFQGLPESRDLAIVTWSPPIVFQPDGSSLDQTIVVSDSHTSTSAELALRGLTGGVSITRRQ